MTYSQDFQSKITDAPIKHRLRLFDFQLKRVFHQLELRKLNLHGSGSSIVPVSALLQPPPYHYQGYRGPWIEDFFYRYWIKNRIQSHLTYLPIFFDCFYQHSQSHKYRPQEFERIQREIKYILHEIIQPSQLYFTILGMYDHPIWDWHEFPLNILVFSANGGGDIPIPLLMGSPNFECPPKDIKVSFMGRLDGASNRGDVRQRVYEHLKDVAYFGQGADWPQIMARSQFTLCPRGLGRASFRLYEAISRGSIPIYIWDDQEWLPYQDVLDWSEIAISINIQEIQHLPEIIQAHSEADIKRKQKRISELYPQFFTLETVCQNIARTLDRFHSVSDVYQLTQKRTY
jgi:hypothetical protein